MHRTTTMGRRGGVFVAVTIALALIAAGCSSDGSDASDRSDSASTTTTTKAGAATNDPIGPDGRFAHAAPRLAKQIDLEPNADGGATATFSVDYDVAHPTGEGGAAPDEAAITVGVASGMLTTGPRPNDQVFTKTITDTELDADDVTRDYSIDLPAEAYQVLQEQGDTGRHLLHVEVQQQRDFQVVDGKLDWIHGTTFDAASSPTGPSDDPGGAVSVRNDTATGISSYDWDSYDEPVAQEYGANVVPDTGGYSSESDSSPGVTVALSGEAVSCLYQGTDGSNPSGFNVTLDPGVMVTQTIVADDKSTDAPANANDTAGISEAVIESINAALEAVSAITEAGFSAPFTLIVDMADAVFGLGTNCNNQPNVFQLSAVTANGQGTNNTSWAIWDGCSGTCGGLANVYSSPWESSAPNSDAEMATQAVQLAPSTETYEGQQLWLNQVPLEGGCGVGDGSSSNTSGCTSQNVISLQWLTSPPCPWTNGLALATGEGVQGNSSWCFQTAPTSPAIPACGTGNADCVAYDPDS